MRRGDRVAEWQKSVYVSESERREEISRTVTTQQGRRIKEKKEGKELEVERKKRRDSGQLREGEKEYWIQFCRFSCITFFRKISQEGDEGDGRGTGAWG